MLPNLAEAAECDGQSKVAARAVPGNTDALCGRPETRTVLERPAIGKEALLDRTGGKE